MSERVYRLLEEIVAAGEDAAIPWSILLEAKALLREERARRAREGEE